MRLMGPALSVVPAVAGTALVQALAPGSVALPAGQARFDVAGAWAVLTPGALAGLPIPAPTAAGWVQLGLLQRMLLGGTAQSVLGATHGVLIVAAVVSVVLLWALMRRLGVGLLAAGVAAAAFGIAPESVAVHATASTADLAAVWLLLAALLATRRRGAGSPVGVGLAAGLAVLADPIAAVALPLVALLEAAPPRRAVRPVEEPVDRPGRRLAAAGGALAAVLALAGVVAVLLAAAPRTASGQALAALVAAAPPLGAGVASLAAWVARDPLSLLIGAVGLVWAAVRGRWPVAVAAAIIAALSVWPAGHDAAGPVALLLPLVAAATAWAVDGATTTLGHPLFRVSVTGAGWLMGVAALIVVSLAIWLGSLADRGAGTPAPVGQASSWVAASVPAGQTVLVDLAAWPDLAERAHATVGWYATGVTAGVASSAPFRGTDWVVADGALRRAASGSTAAVLRSGTSVAQFGSGSAAVQVLDLPASPTRVGTTPGAAPSTPPSSSASAAPDPSEAAAIDSARRTAGTELASNPALTIDPASRALLTSGQVDARVSIALGQLLSGHEVTVAGFPAVPGASGARRQVLVSAVDGHPVPADSDAAGVVLRYFSALRGAYAIDTMDAGTSGVLVTFPADPTFLP